MERGHLKPGLDCGGRERWVAAILAGLVLLQFLPAWGLGLTPFWGDLTYLHHPWRALPAQLIQSGRAPLWNPYIYFGMPMLASMQGALFYPLTIPFYLFDFSTGLALFHLFHYWLAGWLMYLWLRTLRLSRLAALAGGIAYCLGGMMLSRMPFLNHLATLSLGPAFLLFFHRPGLLALALALAFLAGYPVFLPGVALAAWVMWLILRPGREVAAADASGPCGGLGGWGARDGILGPGGIARSAAAWLAAGAGAMLLCACVLLPAAELAANCRRAGGMGLDETLSWGYGLKDLVQWISPLLVPITRFNPAVDWYKCAYLGFSGWAAAGLGLWATGRRKAAWLLAFLGLVAILILGKSNPLSTALWAHVPALKYVRYPGNLSYLAWFGLAALVAAGIEARLRRERVWAAADQALDGMRRWGAVLLVGLIAAELSAYAFGAMPMARRDLFTLPGPLVRELQRSLGAARYLMSPVALESNKGYGIEDWKWRLYGLTNAPFRLPAGGNFGEPLVPRGNYDFMDFLYTRQGADAAARFFKWAGVGVLLTPVPAKNPGPLRHAGKNLWEMYRLDGAARAYWLDERTGESLPAGLPAADFAPLEGEAPLFLIREREDRFWVGGDAPAPGWAYVAEPFFAGWKVSLESDGAFQPAESLRALSAFQKIRVPAGRFRLLFRYDPWTWRLGVLLTLAGVLGFGHYWYNRLSST